MTDFLSRRRMIPRNAARRRLLGRGLERLEDRTNPNVAFGIDTAGLNVLTFDTSAPDTATVDAFHDASTRAGYRSLGAPGLRPEYHAGYHGAFLADPDSYLQTSITRILRAASPWPLGSQH